MKGPVILLAVAMYVICCPVSLENAAKAEIIRSVEYPPAVIITFVSLFSSLLSPLTIAARVN